MDHIKTKYLESLLLPECRKRPPMAALAMVGCMGMSSSFLIPYIGSPSSDASSLSSSDRSNSSSSLCSSQEGESTLYCLEVEEMSPLPEIKKSVSWSEPLFDIRYIEKEGRGQSVRKFRKEVGQMMQRRRRSEEISSLRECFVGTDIDDDCVFADDNRRIRKDSFSSFDDLDLEPRSKKQPYDLSKATFTFKKMNYEPTKPVLTQTNEPSKVFSPLMVESSKAAKTSPSKKSDCRGDISLSMQKNMMSKIPPFLRGYGGYGVLLTRDS